MNPNGIYGKADDSCNFLGFQEMAYRFQSPFIVTSHQEAMTDHSDSYDPVEFAERSSLYREFLAERNEILKHKWLKSERVGEDIGFEAALLDWVRNHRRDWRTVRRNHSPYFG